MKFFLLGLNHKTSPVDLRETLAFSSTDIERFITEKKKDLGAQELCGLSTCNRVEFYGTHDQLSIIKDGLRNAVLAFKGVNLGISPMENFYYFEGDRAVRHLFEVSSGIDSMVVGETQILGQVKEAYTLSTRLGSNGPLINKVFHQAFRVGKRSRTETSIGKGILSISHAAVELSKKMFSDLAKRSVLLVGAGETGELALKHFKDDGIGKLWVTNRSIEKAQGVSKRLGGSVIPFDEYKGMLAKVDIAIFSTSAGEYILKSEDAESLRKSRRLDPLFIIDISVPRNVDPEVSNSEDVFLYDIDDLKGIVEENAKLRKAEIKKVNSIINEEIKKYRQWAANLEFEPLKMFIKKELEGIKNSEMSKARKKLGDKFDQADALVQSIINKIANRPLQKLRRFNVNTHSYVLRSSLVEELFREDEE